MKIIEITVSAGRTFNDPYESYANYKPHVTLKASINDEKDSVDVAISTLQGIAEDAVDRAKKRLLERAKEISDRASKKYNLECAIEELSDDVPF